MGKPTGTMQEKFLKKSNEKAKAWFQANGFQHPFEEARHLDDVPGYVKTYFKAHKQRKTITNGTQPGEE